MKIQEQVQNLAEFINAIKHASTSSHSYIIFMFLLNASFLLDVKSMKNR